MALEDQHLIARVVATGDNHAFGVLTRRHQSSVRAVLRRMCAGDEATADDLAQEVFIRAYQNLDRFRGDAKFSSWLYRIAYNVFISHSRKRGGNEVPVETHVEETAPPGPPTDARHDLNRAMASLRPEERAALSLTYGRDLTHEEAAEILGCPIGTLKTNILRGKEKLRARLRAWQNEVVT